MDIKKKKEGKFLGGQGKEDLGSLRRSECDENILYKILNDLTILKDRICYNLFLLHLK